MAFLRRLFGFCIRRLQRISVYRRIGRFFRFGIDIKEANEEEHRAVYAWFHPGGCETCVSRNPGTINFVAKKRNKVIGFVQLVRYTEDSYPYVGHWLFSLKVRDFYRGIGIGESLTRTVIERARMAGAEKLSLLVRENNRRARNLYRKLGFEMKVIPALEVRLEEERLTHGRRSVLMCKSLA